MTTIGEAYGFFHYQGLTSDIEGVLPSAREKASSPLELTLELSEDFEALAAAEPALGRIVEKAQRAHMSHVLRAQLPGAGNRKAATEIGDLLNEIYRSPLYDKKAPFCAGIVYKRGEEYVFRRD